jgi:hypothetical protein
MNRKMLYLLAIITTVLIVSGCVGGSTGGPAATTIATTTASSNAINTAPASGGSSYKETDYGPYTGTTYQVGKTCNNMKNFTVTLDTVLVGNRSFGKISDGGWLTKSFNETEFIVANVTLTAKQDTDMATLVTATKWDGGSLNGGARYDTLSYDYQYTFNNQDTMNTSQKYGFFVQGLITPMKAGEVKHISIYHKLTSSAELTGDKVYLWVYDDNELMDTGADCQFDITQYVK